MAGLAVPAPDDDFPTPRPRDLPPVGRIAPAGTPRHLTSGVHLGSGRRDAGHLGSGRRGPVA